MPRVIPNIPFAPPIIQSGNVTVARPPSAVPSSIPGGRLDAAFAASPRGGQATSLCSLGFDAGGPQFNERSIFVSAPASTVEHALAWTPFLFGGFARSTAGLRVYLEEFTAGGGFVGATAGPVTSIFNVSAFFGPNVHVAQKSIFATMTHPVVKGNQYRVWIDLVQSVVAVRTAVAVSNCRVTLGPTSGPFIGSVFFNFV
jgi:hypothetical protein